MRLTSVLAGLMAWIGAAVAFRYLPNRRSYAQFNGSAPQAEDEIITPDGATQDETVDGPQADEPRHLDTEHAPVPEHADHEPQHAQS